ncbi:peptide chain release factor N(5)-glutamine methyltransferase [Hymenobacter metallilatus]|uniref:Release factor glutamine methyltransferase n=1 Tax=Hymenobacter metallilatus TaxID=2493666 RepID=A0A3R9P8V4_9BACT|nr:peptide chain release factor N(5)-glutamine methyltransferase [Hymenobacter metallilatus]RSK31192.1 peptide chain release factor N(5)-glutamine methyltransferase [Hymenobacter metallilatus]
MPTLRQYTEALASALQPVYEAPEAQAIAGEVLEQVLQLTPLQRRVQAQQEIPAASLGALAAIQARLLQHEPLQYVLGVAHFAGLALEVTPATLIPRPETEELVEWIVREQTGRAGLRVLDVGTGSGCIPVALGRRLPGAHITTVDIDPEALAVARRNARRYEVAVTFQQADILTTQPADLPAPVDVLVSNPPYVLENERPFMRANVLAYEPATALFVPNHDPLLFYRRIAELGTILLASGGKLYVEINEQFAEEIMALFQGAGYQETMVQPDIFGKPRMARATWPGPA